MLTSAILTNLGINHHFVLASYNSDPTPSHIYVQLEDGCIIDAVWGIFDSEKKPFYKYEVKPNGKMKVKTLTGLGEKPMGNPLVYAALAVAPSVIDALKRDKKVTGLGGCGCGCNACQAKSVTGIGAFELDAASKAYCDRTYPVKKTFFGDTNYLLREGCYVRERAQDQTKKSATQAVRWAKDLNLKQYLNAPFRSLYLGLIEFNIDGYAKRLQDNPDKRAKLEQQYTRWGGDARKVFEAIKKGAAKKPLNLNFFTTIEKAIEKVLPKGIKGIGQTSSNMTDAERAQFYKELAKLGIPNKPWEQMTKEEKSLYISDKLTSGVIGAGIRTGLDAGGAAVTTAICSPLNIAAAVCTPLGAIVGEAVYAQIPDLVDMVVRSDGKYAPKAPSGDSQPTPSRTGTYQGEFTPEKKSDNTALFVVGGIIGGYLIYDKFLKK